MGGLRSVVDSSNAILGTFGTTLFADTTSRTAASVNTEYWCYIIVIADAVFTTLTDARRDGTAIGTNSFPAGLAFPCKATTIRLASGKILAIKAR